MKDLYSKINLVQAVVPVLVVDSTVPTTVEIDLKGYNSCVIEITHAAKPVGDTGTIDVTLTHADDDGTGASGSYANVATADVNGVTTVTSGVILNLATGLVAAAVHKVGYVGGKRFIKAAVTESNSNSTGTYMAITIIKGNPENPLV